MRKEIVYGSVLALVLSLMPAISMANGVWGRLQEGSPVTATTNNLPSDAKSKTVYLIVGANAVVPKDAYYSPSENRIYINERKHLMNYNVHENQHYGQDSAKGKYKYRAGDYFFNL